MSDIQMTVNSYAMLEKDKEIERLDVLIQGYQKDFDKFGVERRKLMKFYERILNCDVTDYLHEIPAAIEEYEHWET